MKGEPRPPDWKPVPTHWPPQNRPWPPARSEEHTSELQSQSNLVCRLLLEKNNWFVRCAASGDNLSVLHQRPLFHLTLAAKPENLTPGSACKINARRIVSIQDREVFGLLILENSCLGIDIGLEGVVAIKMVRGDVQHHRDLRAKGMDG